MTNPTNSRVAGQLDNYLQEFVNQLPLKATEIGYEIIGENVSSLVDTILALIQTTVNDSLPEPENFGNGYDDLVHLSDIKANLAKALGQEL